MRPAIFLVLIFFIYGFSTFAGPLQNISNKAEFESFLAEAGFNGVLAVEKKQTLIFKKAFGVRDFTSNNAILISDKFQIGSVTKQFVAAAILKLQDQGLLSIDDEVTKYLPHMKPLAGISIKDVLNHTAGIANYTDQPAFWQRVDYDKVLSLDEILSFIAELPSDFPARSNWKYSNSGYIIAGKIIETVSGLSWDVFIRKNLLQPLHMNDTDYEAYFERVSAVVGHITNTDGSLTAVSGFNMSWAASAGALHSTVDDMLKWMQIFDSSDLLSTDAKNLMQTPFKKNYGLGLIIDRFNNETRLTHGGRTPGFATGLAYLKESKLKVISFDSTDGGKLDVNTLALNFFAKGSAQALKVKPYPVDASTLQDYVGDFESTVSKLKFNVFVKENGLFLQPNDGQPAYALIANDKDSFRLMGIAGEEFIRDANNQVVELKHYQGGGISVFKKLTR